MRECVEELGIPAAAITLKGCSRPRITGTGFNISPFIGLLHAPLALKPDRTEVADVFEIPLALACDPHAYETHTALLRGVARTHDKLPFGNYHIWGATAGILRDLCRAVASEISYSAAMEKHHG